MTGDDFTRNMDMLVAALQPYRWKAENAAAYWKVFENYDARAFSEACHRLMMTEPVGKMVSIPRMMREIQLEKVAKPQGCEKCDQGRIYYTITHPDSKQEYERFAACDCEAGDLIADHISYLSKRRAMSKGLLRPSADVSQYRYTEVLKKYRHMVVSTIENEVPKWDRPQYTGTSKSVFQEVLNESNKT
jgi:hypothetical protein